MFEGEGTAADDLAEQPCGEVEAEVMVFDLC